MNKHAISFCVTNFNRHDLLLDAIRTAAEHPIVDEIVIVDDHSESDIFNALATSLREIKKVRLYRNDLNLGCYKCKREAISKASNEWCVIADSDNTFEKDYFDRIETLMNAGVNPQTVYQPSWAKPHFDFRKFEGELINRNNIGYFLDKDKDRCGTMLNAFNYFVNRDEYLKVWEDRPEPWTADSILHNYNWLKAGNSIYVTPGLEYGHRISDYGDQEGSHYKANVHKTPAGLYDEIIVKLSRLH